jgi:hypothetical protein
VHTSNRPFDEFCLSFAILAMFIANVLFVWTAWIGPHF